MTYAKVASCLMVALALGTAARAEPPADVRNDIETVNRLLRERQARGARTAQPSPPPPPAAAPAPAPATTPPAVRSPEERGIREAIDGLGSDEPEVRLAAALRLRTAGATAVPALIDALEDLDVQVRVGAAEILGDRREAGAVEALIPFFKGTDEEILIARNALVRIGAPAVAPLLGELRRGDEVYRRWIIIALGRLRDNRAVEPLVEVLARDPETGVRVQAAWALGRLRDRRASEALLDALHDGSVYVQMWARRALTGITGRDLGPDEDAWRRWWRENGEAFLAAEPPPDEEKTAR